jgi:ribosomal protein S18 acetylase RimI-like enzyme
MTASYSLSLERHAVRKVTPADVPALAKAMARAFYDDPVAGGWCLADESRRLRRLERGFELFLRRVYLAHDECQTTDDLVGGALWLPPGKWKLGGLEQLMLVAGMARAFGRPLPRILQVLGFLEGRHPHEPHYYLQFVGVEPEWQGRGVGSSLLGPVLRRCDREGIPAYLEASSERSRSLYERHGFEVVEEVRLPAGGPPMWPMWREAGR